MAIKTLNQYKGTYEGEVVSLCNAETIVKAAEILSDENEPSIIQKVSSGIKVEIPDPALSFTTLVAETEKAAGCKAYPVTGGAVENGQTVYLSAVAAEGYTFDGWYQGNTKVAETAEAAVVVASTSSVPALITYEAKFSASI